MVRRKGDEVTVTGGGGSKGHPYPPQSTKFEAEESRKNQQIENIARICTSTLKSAVSAMGKDWQLTMLGVSATGFETRAHEDSNIQHFFATAAATAASSSASASASAASSRASSAAFSVVDHAPGSMEDVDEGVLALLPADIQEELKNRLSKRKPGKFRKHRNTLKRAFAKTKSLSRASDSGSSSEALEQMAAAPGTGAAHTADTATRLGYDPEVLRALPDDILTEVLSGNGRQRHHPSDAAAAVPAKLKLRKVKKHKGIQKFFLQ